MNVTIRIQSVEDSKNGPAFPELQGKPFQEIEITSCAILERGTAGGRTSLFLHGLNSEGGVVAFQITGRMLETLLGAVRGAEARWASGHKQPDLEH